jgi:hypothetical protein
MRAGGASDAFQAGVPLHVIDKHGRRTPKYTGMLNRQTRNMFAKLEKRYVIINFYSCSCSLGNCFLNCPGVVCRGEYDLTGNFNACLGPPPYALFFFFFFSTLGELTSNQEPTIYYNLAYGPHFFINI